MIDYSKLIPALDGWSGSSMAPSYWLGSFGKFDHAIGYAALFWPEFIVVDDCVFLGSERPASYELWRNKLGSKSSEIEALLNHQHLLDLFPTSDAPTHAQLEFLGRALRDMWLAKLKHDFPDRQFEVFFEEPFDLKTDNPAVSFYQKTSG